MKNILEINNLSKDYGEFKLKDINLNLPKGSIMGLIGENGAGKSTTIKLILNLIKRKSGDIKIFGLDNIRNEKEIKEQLGVVLDESYFHDNLNSKDVSSIMSKVYKNWDSPVFDSYLKKFKLPEKKIIKEYSRGMKMKLSIAVALSHNPKLLILDEATSGLDPLVRNEILDVLLDFIQDEEHSILISSHITSDLEKIADYITFIHQGEIVFSEEKDGILDSHGILRCGAEDFKTLDEESIVAFEKSSFGYNVLIKDRQKLSGRYNNFIIDKPTFEDIMLLYTRRDK
ncbi:ABC transporter ATP-binding protein [Alloiococcus sp. CFN-8]|uniref:ABC transporter ATP-binding protein n=1 Tax=Alloiococcus sp. CFN-8 TaxID=3416081 RepID=UPI003CEA9345